MFCLRGNYYRKLHKLSINLSILINLFLSLTINEIGTQRVSTTARIIHGIFGSFLFVAVTLAILHILAWLDFLYYCSYVKLAITLIKYVPQAYYNYKRKSTDGWSIGNIFLDFTGGILSMLQMILNAYNYGTGFFYFSPLNNRIFILTIVFITDDWESIFGDPTKFGLGFFSVAFDIFFLVQHYAFYRRYVDYVSYASGTANSLLNGKESTRIAWDNGKSEASVYRRFSD